MNRWLKSIVTLSLAVFYALIASCGHGLHSHGVSCCGSDCEETACCADCQSCPSASSVDGKQACIGHSHFAELRKALNENESRKANHGQPLIRSADASFSLHDCVACQLLSQIELGFTISESHAGAWLNLSHPPLLNDSLTTETKSRSFDARGPPSNC